MSNLPYEKVFPSRLSLFVDAKLLFCLSYNSYDILNMLFIFDAWDLIKYLVREAGISGIFH